MTTRYQDPPVLGPDAPDLFVEINGVGGWVCAVCEMPVESEPCATHQENAYARIDTIEDAS